MAENNVIDFDELNENLKEENYLDVTIKELEDKIVSMKADREKKCKAAKEQLVSMLDITADKYRTATGTAEALRVIRFVIGDNSRPTHALIDIDVANELAWKMAGYVEMMAKKADKLSYDKMDQICDGFYDKEFTVKNEGFDDMVFKLAEEMLKIDLCRNVGEAAEDMVSFVQRVHEEIDATGEKLKELKAQKAAKKD
jgi:hypothetical protein